MPYTTTAPATYFLNDSDIAGSIVCDTQSFRALKGGVLTITKFDTVNNLISGTFHFIAYLGYPTVDKSVLDTVADGSFTDVPIYDGIYNQGTISADVDGFHMSSKGKSDQNSNSNNATAYTAKEYGVFTIHAVSSDGAALNREVYLNVVSPAVGTFSLGDAVGPNYVHGAEYQKWDPHSGGYVRMTATAGTLTITKFDAVTRRMSGTFSFLGLVYPNNDTLRVTNGVIDNVQWSVF